MPGARRCALALFESAAGGASERDILGQSTDWVEWMVVYGQRYALYHYVPAVDELDASLTLASPFASQLLCKRFNALTEADRERFMSAVKLSSEAAALYRCVLVKSVLELLETGSRINARQLEANGNELKLRIQPFRPIGLLKSTLSGSELSGGGSSFKPESNAFESIDAVYVIKSSRAQAPWGHVKATLFHAAVSGAHPVKAKSIRAVLQQLDIVPQDAALVFVVPECDAVAFKRQKIAAARPLDNSSPMTVVSHIRSAHVAALEGTNIRTVGDLRDAPPDAKFDEKQRSTYESARKCLWRHENEAVVSASETHRALEQMPQFVLGL